MKKVSIVALAALAVVAHAEARAEGLYLGANYQKVTYSEDGFSDIKPATVGLRLGYGFTENFAIEGRFGVGSGAGDATIRVSGTNYPVSMNVENYAGAYVKLIAPANEVFSVYGVIGASSVKVKLSSGSISMTDSDSSASFGVGADIAFSKSVGLNLEWTKLLKKDGVDMNALSAGMTFGF